MQLASSPLVCQGGVVKKIFGGGSAPKQTVVRQAPAGPSEADLKAQKDLEKRQAEQDSRDKDLKKQERARRAAIAAAQRGSRLLLYNDEKGVQVRK